MAVWTASSRHSLTIDTLTTRLAASKRCILGGEIYGPGEHSVRVRADLMRVNAKAGILILIRSPGGR